jgi:hypothetical protein
VKCDVCDYLLSTNGNFDDTGFWFCSIDCYKKCVGKYLDQRFHFDTRVEDDPMYITQVGEISEEYARNTSNFLYVLFHLLQRESELKAPAQRRVTEWWIEAKHEAIRNAETEVLKYINAELHYRNEEADEKKRQELLKQHEAIDKGYDKLLAPLRQRRKQTHGGVREAAKTGGARRRGDEGAGRTAPRKADTF